MKFIKFIGFVILGFFGLVFIGLVILLLLDKSDPKSESESSLVQCKPIDKRIYYWFPRGKGKILSFSNGSGEVDKVVLDTVHIKHTESFNPAYKCGTCDDMTKFSCVIDADTLEMFITKENEEFEISPFLNKKEGEAQMDSSSMRVKWVGNAGTAKITAACFKPYEGLIWYERNKKRFYPVNKKTVLTAYFPKRNLLNVTGCR